MLMRREAIAGFLLAGLATVQPIRHQNIRNIRSFGAIGDGVSDDTAALAAALNALGDGETLDLEGLHLNIFVGVAGKKSGDAFSLSEVPRLVGKKDVTIENGTIAADDPGISKSRLRFPSSLTIDGCERIMLRNLTVHSKGQGYGDTDASRSATTERRRSFAAQNGGHAILIVRSIGTRIEGCRARLCGSVGSIYIMSSHQTSIERTFSNPGSPGYAAFAFDSWAGDSSVSGFPAHAATMTDCSASKEQYKYGSKGCVLTEDADVTVTVNGGYFADAYPNGTSRDLGYAFGCSSSRTIVTGAVVENCAALGYTGTTTQEDFSYLKISDVKANALRKTVHQTESTSVGRMYWEYERVTASVTKGGTWKSDGNLSRETTSYLAMPNLALRVDGSFVDCQFMGARYGFINTTSCYGRILWRKGTLVTNGFLWNSANIGAGSPGMGRSRGILFDDVSIVDVSHEQGPYCATASDKIYTNIDLSTSTITLNSDRPLDSRKIVRPGMFLERYSLPKPRIRES